MTAAVATWNGDEIPDAALDVYDFLNVMSYDHCGQWSTACDHSTVSAAQADLTYWVEDRGYPADRAVLGVPFYGYCWGGACSASALTYAELHQGWPVAATTDWIEGDGYTISLNSAVTIGEQAVLAREHGGIMIWELGQDAVGEASLLRVIAEGG